jgi:hypothetical protein
VRCVLYFDFNFVCTDNTDNVTLYVVLLGSSKPCYGRVINAEPPVGYLRSTYASEALAMAGKCSPVVERLTAETFTAVGVLAPPEANADVLSISFFDFNALAGRRLWDS